MQQSIFCSYFDIVYITICNFLPINNLTKNKRYIHKLFLERQNGEIDESDVEETKPKEWWQQYCDGPELEKIENSGKMLLLFELLKECEQIGDKV